MAEVSEYMKESYKNDIRKLLKEAKSYASLIEEDCWTLAGALMSEVNQAEVNLDAGLTDLGIQNQLGRLQGVTMMAAAFLSRRKTH